MRVIFGRGRDELPSLFTGDAWMNAAEAWAREKGWKVIQWRVDRQFRVAQGEPSADVSWLCWFRIEWNDGNKQWEVMACE